MKDDADKGRLSYDKHQTYSCDSLTTSRGREKRIKLQKLTKKLENKSTEEC